MESPKIAADYKFDSKNVCTDMLQRLQAQIPGVELPKYGEAKMPPLTHDEKLADLESRFKELQKSLETKEAEPEPKKKLSDREAADEIAGKLKAIVEDFNAKLKDWHDLTGCVANFGWNYTGGKNMEVTSIDYIVYRREPPSAKTIKDVLEQKPAEV